MNSWGYKSLEVRSTLHPLLVLILDHALQICDMSLVEGHRSEDRQKALFDLGASKVLFPDSKHNMTRDPNLYKIKLDLSDAVDVIPYPEGYADIEQMTHLIGIIRGIAAAYGIKIRCGLDWNGDGQLNNEKGDFYDVCHLELIF